VSERIAFAAGRGRPSLCECAGGNEDERCEGCYRNAFHDWGAPSTVIFARRSGPRLHARAKRS
jgi:hypothetical protein